MTKAAIVGYGNIGRRVLESLQQAPDFEVCGVVRRNAGGEKPRQLQEIQVVDHVEKLTVKPDVAILCVPTRKVQEAAQKYLSLGISTVDSFDIHKKIPALRAALQEAAQKAGRVAVISAGWDPGSDSVVRALLEACAPRGITYTNFGPGMSMGHSVALRAMDGVKDAMAVTIPTGAGVHRRICYIQPEEGVDPEIIRRQVREDDYFSKDETHIKFVPCVDDVRDMGHGVCMERKGVSGVTQNQRFSFAMQIDNPALTAQVMVSCARAAMRQAPGCYTMIELPPVDLLPGNREGHVARLV